jgi:hypothetical protein
MGNTIRTSRVVMASFSASKPAPTNRLSHGAASTPSSDTTSTATANSPSAE